TRPERPTARADACSSPAWAIPPRIRRGSITRRMRRLQKLSCSILLLTACFALTAAGAQARTPKCHGHTATIVGTSHNDVIRGTRHRDVIVAGRGNDRVSAGGGNDLVCGGAGNDPPQGRPGRDRPHRASRR